MVREKIVIISHLVLNKLKIRVNLQIIPTLNGKAWHEEGGRREGGDGIYLSVLICYYSKLYPERSSKIRANLLTKCQ